MTSFPYSPLNADQIRLLRISSSSNPDSPIKCFLEHASFEVKSTKYEALSYTWGTSQRTHAITIDGHEFPVTRNLHAALVKLRHHDQDRRLWIDAICINQNDLAERSREVLRMLRIYQQAEQVIVWLGEESHNSSLAMAHFRQLNSEWHSSHPGTLSQRAFRLFNTTYFWSLVSGASFVRILRGRPFVSAWCFLFMSNWLPRISHWALRLPFRLFNWYMALEYSYSFIRTLGSASTMLHDQKAQPSEELVQSLSDFYERSWFRRAWIIQEVAAAREVTILCGANQIPWQTLVNASTEIQNRVANSSVSSPYNTVKYLRGGSLGYIVSKAAASNDLSVEPAEPVDVSARYLQQLLGQFRYSEATDDRDKIYALLGLAFCPEGEAATQQIFIPDYQKPTSKVYTELVKLLVTTTGNLDILRFSQSYRKIDGLPSWVPDWTCRGVLLSSPSALNTKGYKIPSDPDYPVATFSEDLQCMHIRGFVIGLIDKSDEVVIASDGTLSSLSKNIPSFAGYILRYFVNGCIWFFQSPLSGFLVRLIQRLLRVLVSCFPQRGGPLAIILDIMDDATQAISEDKARREKLKKHKNNKIDRTAKWAGLPVAMDNLYRMLDATDQEYALRKVEWRTVLSKTLMGGADFETYAKDVQPGDLVCLMVGSGEAHILRQHGNYYTLMGVADLGMAVRWYWRDALQEYKKAELELEEFELR